VSPSDGRGLAPGDAPMMPEDRICVGCSHPESWHRRKKVAGIAVPGSPMAGCSTDKPCDCVGPFEESVLRRAEARRANCHGAGVSDCCAMPIRHLARLGVAAPGIVPRTDDCSVQLTEKQQMELRAVELLNAGAGLDLHDLRPASVDPPDVEGRLAERTVGIEVTRPIESGDKQTSHLFSEVVLPRVQTGAASAAPGAVSVGTHYLRLDHVGRAGLDSLANQLTDVVLSLSAFAERPGTRVVAASGQLRETLAETAYEPGERWTVRDLQLPLGIESVFFRRTEDGELSVVSSGALLPTVFGCSRSGACEG
jgi:hypothetical protein